MCYIHNYKMQQENKHSYQRGISFCRHKISGRTLLESNAIKVLSQGHVLSCLVLLELEDEG
jgi:hypothetical protein